MVDPTVIYRKSSQCSSLNEKYLKTQAQNGRLQNRKYVSERFLSYSSVKTFTK